MSYRSAPTSTPLTARAKVPAAKTEQVLRQPQASKETLILLALMPSILANAQGSHGKGHEEDWQECCDCLKLDANRAKISGLSGDLDLLPSLLQKPVAAFACIARIQQAFIEASHSATLYNESVAPETASLERLLRTCYAKLARIALTSEAYEPIANALELIGGIDGQAANDARLPARWSQLGTSRD